MLDIEFKKQLTRGLLVRISIWIHRSLHENDLSTNSSVKETVEVWKEQFNRISLWWHEKKKKITQNIVLAATWAAGKKNEKSNFVAYFRPKSDERCSTNRGVYKRYNYTRSRPPGFVVWRSRPHPRVVLLEQRTLSIRRRLLNGMPRFHH